MILINTSDVLAQLLPEVHYSLDPDLPPDHELSFIARRYLKALLLRAFRQVLTEEHTFELTWVLKLKQDPCLCELSHRPWLDVDVLDTDGTYLIILGEH